MTPQGKLAFGVHCNLPGEVQTVPRGEIYALYLLLVLASPLSTLDYVTDNLPLYDMWVKGPKHSRTTNNCDLYNAIYQIAYDKAINFTVRWVPSHLLENPTKGVFTGCSLLDILGNDQADKLADIAARQACVSLDVSAPILYYISLAKRIQNRLATILINLPDRPKHERERKHQKPVASFKEMLSSTSHILFESEGRHKCARCLCSFNAKDPAIKHWLQSQCIAQGSNIDRPIKLLFSHVHIGNQCAHVSHDLYIFCGLIYCNRCGVRSGRLGFKLLAKQCGPPSEYGLQSLNALKQRKKPPNLLHWPSDPDHWDEATPAPKLAFERGRKCRGIALSIKRPKPRIDSSTSISLPIKSTEK